MGTRPLPRGKPWSPTWCSGDGMKRAMVLICVLTVLCVSSGLIVDITQQNTARSYLDALPEVRRAVLLGDMTEAYIQQSLLHANWQHDVNWLNCFVSHHHTRAVTTAMLQLATALEMGWPDEALRSLDILQDCLMDIEKGDYFSWENFL